MQTKKIIAIIVLLALLCGCLYIRFSLNKPAEENPTLNSETEHNTPAPEATPDALPETAPEAPAAPPAQNTSAIDISTIGGVVIVGTMAQDGQGWYIQPEQPLNISFEYFLGNPNLYPNTTRISMFDPKDDGIEKALYLGQTVTAEGTFTFYRDDFENIYFLPYTVTMGKLAEGSHAAPDLTYPDEPANLYDPSQPLPKYLDSTLVDGKYVYNPFMLSMEAIKFMGNDFTLFYLDFVDAFLNYRQEAPCADKRYAEMLSSIVYDEFPLFAACAEPFELFKHYDAAAGTISINYLYDEQTHKALVSEFFNAADTLLAGTSIENSDLENAKIIYHNLSTSVSYDHSALEEFERKETYYVYLQGSGVCVSFANAYTQLLTQVGIDTTLAHCDYPDTIGHTWAIITLDSQQYFCDPTFELNYDGGAGYRYFGQNYDDALISGRGQLGIRYGRYYLQPLTPDMLAETSIG